MDSKKEQKIWKEVLEIAIENKFNIQTWYERCDLLGSQVIAMQCRQNRVPFAEEAKKYMSYTKMKAMAFSHDFALAFFPRKKCEDAECSFCKGDGLGHEQYLEHLKMMCEYENFTCYLEKILDEEL